MDEYGGHRTFAHSRPAEADLRGKFCFDKSAQNLMPLKSCIRRMVCLFIYVSWKVCWRAYAADVPACFYKCNEFI